MGAWDEIVSDAKETGVKLLFVIVIVVVVLIFSFFMRGCSS